MSEQIERESWHDKGELIKTIDKKLYGARTLMQETRVFINHLNMYHGDQINMAQLAKMGRESSKMALICACVNHQVEDMLKELEARLTSREIL